MHRTSYFVIAAAVAAACSSPMSKAPGVVAASKVAARVVDEVKARTVGVRRAAAAPNEPSPASEADFAPILPVSKVRVFENRTGRINPVFASTAAPRSATEPAGAFRPLTRQATVSYPTTASGAVTLTDEASGVRIDVSLVGAKPVPAAAASGYLVYAAALGAGADWLHAAAPDGSEEFILLKGRPSHPIVYDVSLSSTVAGLRLVGGTLEFMDASGAPRLRITPPFLADAHAKRIDASLAILDCAVDTSAAAPWGRPVKAPGATHCHVRVDWPANQVAYPATLDPGWSTTGDMLHEREWPVLAVLDDGRVLVAGGYSPTSDTIANCDLFDPSTGTWAATGSLHTRRTKGDTLTTLVGTGKALIAGGSTAVLDPLTHAFESTDGEVYDSATGTWTVVPGAMQDSRVYHTATRLNDGRVLVAGGYYYDRVALQAHNVASADVYTPSTNSWTHLSARLTVSRQRHAATIHTDGRVVLYGGAVDAATHSTAVAGSSEIFDPATSAFTPTTSQMSANRLVAQGAMVGDGKLVIAGGVNGATGADVPSSQLFDPSTQSWGPASTPMVTARQGHTSATLLSGEVLVAGGSNASSSALSSAEVYSPASHAWTATPNALSVPRALHAMVRLHDRRTLVAGGWDGISTARRLKSAELYEPAAPPRRSF